MGADTGATGWRRGGAGRHRRSVRPLIRRRDHLVPRRGARPFPAPSSSALMGIAVLVLIALGVVHLSGSGSAVPLETAPTPAQGTTSPAVSDPPSWAAVDGGGPEASRPSPEQDSASESARIIVHVSGAVTAPGVVRLAPDARVDDALDAAGGPTEEADLSAVNLARPLADGEQIHVPVPGEEPRPHAAASSAPDAGTGGEGEGAPIDLNTAGTAELEELPGVGPAIAGRIVEHREKNGPFTSVDSLLEVSGIGPATLEEIRGRATV